MNSTFIESEKINLCAPIEEDLAVWSSWFNDPALTRFLEQGRFPNSPDLQREFLSREIGRGRFIAMIKTKGDRLLGVVSLSDINYEKRSAQLSYLCPVKDESARYAALEAAACCTQHGFERFGLERVWSGHAFPGLDRWIKKMEIIGFFTEGFFESGFRHGRYVSDSVRTALISDRFDQLVRVRGGHLWPGQATAARLLKEMDSRRSLADSVADSVKSLQARYLETLQHVEVQVSEPSL